jgi:hypothetical protein
MGARAPPPPPGGGGDQTSAAPPGFLKIKKLKKTKIYQILIQRTERTLSNNLFFNLQCSMVINENSLKCFKHKSEGRFSGFSPHPVGRNPGGTHVQYHWIIFAPTEIHNVRANSSCCMHQPSISQTTSIMLQLYFECRLQPRLPTV